MCVAEPRGPTARHTGGEWPEGGRDTSALASAVPARKPGPGPRGRAGPDFRAAPESFRADGHTTQPRRAIRVLRWRGGEGAVKHPCRRHPAGARGAARWRTPAPCSQKSGRAGSARLRRDRPRATASRARPVVRAGRTGQAARRCVHLRMLAHVERLLGVSCGASRTDGSSTARCSPSRSPADARASARPGSLCPARPANRAGRRTSSSAAHRGGVSRRSVCAVGSCAAWRCPVPAHRWTSLLSPAAVAALRRGAVRWCTAGYPTGATDS